MIRISSIHCSASNGYTHVKKNRGRAIATVAAVGIALVRYPLLWKDSQFLMGKCTIYMAMFNNVGIKVINHPLNHHR